MRTQKNIEKENQFLFGKMETCTLLMGNAIVTGNNDNYELYLIARQEIKDKIEANLDEMNDTVKSFHKKLKYKQHETRTIINPNTLSKIESPAL